MHSVLLALVTTGTHRRSGGKLTGEARKSVPAILYFYFTHTLLYSYTSLLSLLMKCHTKQAGKVRNKCCNASSSPQV